MSFVVPMTKKVIVAAVVAAANLPTQSSNTLYGLVRQFHCRTNFCIVSFYSDGYWYG